MRIDFEENSFVEKVVIASLYDNLKTLNSLIAGTKQSLKYAGNDKEYFQKKLAEEQQDKSHIVGVLKYYGHSGKVK